MIMINHKSLGDKRKHRRYLDDAEDYNLMYTYTYFILQISQLTSKAMCLDKLCKEFVVHPDIHTARWILQADVAHVFSEVRLRGQECKRVPVFPSAQYFDRPYSTLLTIYEAHTRSAKLASARPEVLTLLYLEAHFNIIITYFELSIHFYELCLGASCFQCCLFCLFVC